MSAHPEPVEGCGLCGLCVPKFGPMKYTLVGALVTAAVSTLGDYLWANVLPHRQPIYWFAHAIVLFLTVGFCLGWPSRKPLSGAIGAAVIGCVATAGFYFLQPLM